jgi:GMP synthase-like glutamine amidotransferase
MGVRHRDYVVEGVQFHPESILTEVGHDLLANFLRFIEPVWSKNQIPGPKRANSKKQNAK